MSDVKKWLFVLTLAAAIMVCNGLFSIGYDKNDLLAPYISNKNAFSYELAGNAWNNPEVWVDQWFFNQSAPFKYRLLGKIPIWGTYKMLMYLDAGRLTAFYYSYIAWSYIFISCFLFYSGKLFSIFISRYNLSPSADNPTIFYITTSTLALSPSVLFAFKFPVHGGPNDFLGYLLISLSLLSLIESNIFCYAACVVVGIFCRETNLVTLIPFVLMANFSSGKKWSVITLVGFIFLCYRLGWPGTYNPLGSSLHNFEHPTESMVFFFMTLGPFWLLGGLGSREAFSLMPEKNHFIQAVNKSFYISTTIVTLIVFGLARVREIRIEFILFFYFIPYAVIYCMTKLNQWMALSRSYRLLFLLIAITCITLYGSFMFKTTAPAGYLSRLDSWKYLVILYLAVTLTFLSVDLLSNAENKQNLSK
jgi:hypothetical protein